MARREKGEYFQYFTPLLHGPALSLQDAAPVEPQRDFHHGLLAWGEDILDDLDSLR